MHAGATEQSEHGAGFVLPMRPELCGFHGKLGAGHGAFAAGHAVHACTLLAEGARLKRQDIISVSQSLLRMWIYKTRARHSASVLFMHAMTSFRFDDIFALFLGNAHHAFEGRERLRDQEPMPDEVPLMDRTSEANEPSPTTKNSWSRWNEYSGYRRSCVYNPLV